jgi:nicotinamidase-related amidase
MNAPSPADPRTALIVIDVQQSFTRRPYYDPSGREAFLASQNALIEGAVARGWPVVRVLHESVGGADDPFSPASGHVRPMDGLVGFDAALTVHKTRHSALVGTGLDVWLVAHGIRRLVLSGIRTEQCCETTARHASDLGWQVDFVPEAMWTWEHRGLTATQIRERTVAVLEGRFARVLGVDGALAA